MGTHRPVLQYELWADLARQNKHLRRNNWVHWGIHSLLVLALVSASLKPLMAVRVDQLGQAELIRNVGTVNEPTPEEAEHVARLFSEYLLELTSGSVGRDAAKAMALMTAPFQAAYKEKVRDDPAFSAIENGNVRTVLTFDDEGSEVRAQKDAAGNTLRYFVKTEGTLGVYSAGAFTEPLLSRSIVVRTTLLVVPRTSRTLNGLLVDHFEKVLSDPVDIPPALPVKPLQDRAAITAGGAP